MLRAMRHGLPIVNGYSGYMPVHALMLRLALDSGDEGVLDAFTRDGDLIVAVGVSDRERWSAFVQRHPRARRLPDDGPWRMYAVSRESTPEPRRDVPASTALPIAAVVVSDQPQEVGYLTDKQPDTAWSTRRPQAGDEQLTIDLGRERDIALVRLQLGSLFPGFPRRLTVDCAAEDGRWDVCWHGSAAALAIEGALADARNPTMDIAVHRTGVRRIRLRQTGTAVSAWAIAELTVYEARDPRAAQR